MDTVIEENLIKVWCKNLFCHNMPIYINKDFIEEYKEKRCPYCGHIGFMPDYHILKTGEVIKQIMKLTEKRVLFREAFRVINFDKLPRSIEQQTND